MKIVDDQIGAPTWARLLAEMTSQVVVQHSSPVCRQAIPISDVSGLYHVVPAGSTSWHGFAARILDGLPDHVAHARPKLIPVPTSGYPMPARRPANSRLDGGKPCRTYNLAMPEWDHSLSLCLEEIAQIYPGQGVSGQG